MSLPLVTHDGRLVTDKDTLPPQPEQATEQTTMLDLAQIAFNEALKFSTKPTTKSEGVA